MTGALMSLLGSAAPAGASGAFESIATVTATGGETSLSFSSIPQTYASLHIRAYVKSNNSATGLAGLFGTVNGSSSSVYSQHELIGNGATVSATGNATQTNLNYGVLSKNNASIFSPSIVDIHDYASTTQYKTIRVFAGTDLNGSNGEIHLTSGLYQATTAITSITFQDLTTTGFTAGSTIALYGIKGA